MVLGLVRNLLLADILGQSDYSYWVLFQIFIGYADLVHLGLRTATSREIPILNGLGQSETAAKFRRTALGGTIALSLLVAGILVVAATLILHGHVSIQGYDNAIIAKGLYLSAVLVIAEQLSRYFLTLLRTEHRFFKVSIIEIVYDFGRTGLIALLAMQLEAPGAVSGYAIAVILLVSYFIVFNKPPKPQFSSQEISFALRIGIPLFFASISSLLITSIDRIIAAIILAPEELSIYGFAIPISLIPVLALQSVRDVLFPSFGEMSSGNDELKKFSALFGKAIRLSAILSPLMTVAMLLVIEPIVRTFVPKFNQSIDVMYWMAGATIVFGLGAIPNSVLLVLRKQWVAFRVSIISALVYICFVALTQLFAWHALTSLILGAWLSYSIYTTFTIKRSIRQITNDRALLAIQITRSSAKSVVPAIAALAVTIVLRHYSNLDWIILYVLQVATLMSGLSVMLALNRDVLPDFIRIITQLRPNRQELQKQE